MLTEAALLARGGYMGRLVNSMNKRVMAALLCGVMTVSSGTLPVAASGTHAGAADTAVSSDSAEEGRLVLPSAGISYALSTQKISLRDVENSLYERGLVSQKRTGNNSSPLGGLLNSVSASVYAANSTDDSAAQAADGAESDDAAEMASETAPAADAAEESGIMVTNLTPVQMKENLLVKDGQTQIAENDESAATTISAGAVNVVASTSDALAQKEAETARNEAAAEAAAQARANIEQKQQEEARKEAEAAANPLVVSVANDYVNVREAPSEDAPVVGKLYSKDVGKVLEEADSNGWIRITSGDVTGYVNQQYVATGTQAQDLAQQVGTQKAVVNTTTLLVRAAADKNSDVISLVGEGSSLDIIGEENGWYKVNTEDGEGYVSADFTDVEVEYPEAISREQEEAEEAARKAEEEQKAKEEEEKRKAAEKASGSGGKSGKKSSSSAASSSGGSSYGQQVVNYALQFVGNPYVWGGSSLTHGTDCSGFTMAVYAHFGVSLPHYDGAQRSCGVAVSSLAEAQPGDLVCYYGHVGIYIGGGQIVHASNPRDGIKVSTASYRSIAAIRRIFY